MYQANIDAARNLTKQLYAELEKIKLKTQDGAFLDITKAYATPITASSVKLRPYATLSGHFDKIIDLTWSKDSSSILSLSQDGFMIVWDPTTGLKRYAVPLPNPYGLTCAFSPTGKLIASAGLDNACTVYQLHSDNTSYVKAVLRGHSAYISDCAYISNECIVTGSGDMSCISWDCNKALKIRDFVGHNGDVLCINAAANVSAHGSSNFISGSADGCIKVWDPRQLREAQTFLVSKLDVNCIKAFPGGDMVCTGSDDSVVRLFDIRADCRLAEFLIAEKTGAPARPLAGSGAPGSPASASYTHSLGDNKRISQSSIPDRYKIMYSNLYTPGVNSVDFSRLGRLIFSCYSNHGCVIWDCLAGTSVGTLGGPGNKVSSVATSGDGLAVATVLGDSKIQIWSP